MVIWIIGMSGSGKTFTANYLKKKIQSKFRKKTIQIDGDQLRKLTNNDLGYDINSRRINSLRMQNFCKYLESQGFIVVCSILSIFSEHRKKNKKIFNSYKEIFIYSELEQILKRDKRNIYKKNTNVVGKHIKYSIPKNYDYLVKNNGTKKELIEKLDSLVKNL